jgi:hypothetical protein
MMSLMRDIRKLMAMLNLRRKDPAKAKLQRALMEAFTKYADSPHEEHDCKLVGAGGHFLESLGTEAEELFTTVMVSLGEAVDSAPGGGNEFDITIQRKHVGDEREGSNGSKSD